MHGLLVSVRDAREASAAVAGGADIIDAKEPALGPLAPVSPATLQSICAAVPLTIRFSVALGDARRRAEASSRRSRRSAPVLPASARCTSRRTRRGTPTGPTAAWRRCVRRCDARPDRPRLIVARYVDQAADATDLPPGCDACRRRRARGASCSTPAGRTGGSLFASVDVRSLAALAASGHARAIWLALAGGLRSTTWSRWSCIRPARRRCPRRGVRGTAAPDRLSQARVRQLRHAAGTRQRRGESPERCRRSTRAPASPGGTRARRPASTSVVQRSVDAA